MLKNLRIGNRIVYMDKNGIGVQDNISSIKEAMFNSSITTQFGVKKNLKSIKVPISKVITLWVNGEVLNCLGFAEDRDNGDLFHAPLETSRPLSFFDDIVYKLSSRELLLKKGKDFFSLGVVSSCHELQNIYFDLTRCELDFIPINRKNGKN